MLSVNKMNNTMLNAILSTFLITLCLIKNSKVKIQKSHKGFTL
ncbi:hypothetical protein SAMN05216464_116121 [Mucilaginibacter pineti]|uniref:Uncharacterized protein n=1 Tax=Mucilaginibacter pineti TaxID=1391627 RepID=A0A1G7KGD4_9SPHI|nr:hypothetical protein SAMN05216464_116121 [Mucilaginibacter pineti]